jgi:hypothetical protein
VKLELRIRPRDGGDWTIELWRGGEMTKCYVGAATLHEAADRGVAWMRDARGATNETTEEANDHE